MSFPALPNDLIIQVFKAGLLSLIGDGPTAFAGPDMTNRQTAVMLAVYTDPEQDATVRGIAERLKLSRPVVSRIVAMLEGRQLVQRKPDPNDGRSIIVRQTRKGHGQMERLRLVLRGAVSRTARSTRKAA